MRFWFCLFLIPVLAYGSPAEEPEENRIPILDSTQELFGSHANTVANRLDLFFADQRADDELARSRIRLRQTYEIRERSLMRDDFQIRFNLRLPKLNEKFKFHMENKEAIKEKAKSGTADELQYDQINTNWQFRADVGVNASIPPLIFTRARLRKNLTSGEVIHRFVEELAWFSDRDWEEFTTFDSDLPLSDDVLFRFRNELEWRITRKGFNTSHGPRILDRLTMNDALQYGATLSTVIDNGPWHVTNYRLFTTYRRNLYRQWLYMDLTPGLDFPKAWSFRRTPFLQLNIEALFGGW